MSGSTLVPRSALAWMLLAAPAAQAGRRSPVHQGDWAPTDQASIDAFCRRYTILDGNLRIGAAYEPPNLFPLDCLESVGGEIVIDDAQIDTLAGLHRIVGGQGLHVSALRVRGATRLDRLEGLELLGSTAIQTVELRDNPALVEVSRIAALLPGSRVTITGNPKLERVVLPASLGRKATLDALHVADNGALQSVRGLGQFADVRELRVTDNPALTTLDVLPELTTAGPLELARLPALEALPDWPRLYSADALVVTDLAAITRLPVWDRLARVGTLTLQGNVRLADVSGLVANRDGSVVVDSLRVLDNPLLSGRKLALMLQDLRVPTNAVRRVKGGAYTEE